MTATRVALDLLASDLVVSAVDWVDGTLAVRVEGRQSGVEQQVGDLIALLDRHGLSANVVEGEAQAALWDGAAGAHAGTDGETVVRAAALPDAFGAVAEAFGAVRAETGVPGDLAAHLGNGLTTARLGGDDAVHAAAVTAWRRRVEALGGHVVVRRRREAMTDPDLIWGAPGSAVGLMRAVKSKLDPAGRCAPGRYVGGI
jgi:glycolate oxidase FAD binding subunit